MRIIQPITIAAGTPLLEYGALSLNFLTQQYALADPVGDPTVLIASNVPEDDYPLWGAGSFVEGDRVLFKHQVYEALATTAAQPDIGAVADPPTWLLVGSANRWKMFDDVISSQTEQAGIITVSIAPGGTVNALALFALAGSELRVKMTDPVEGVVYQTTLSLQDNSSITDWYHYFFDDVIQIGDAVLLDLPAFRSATIEISVIAGAEMAKCGALVLGEQRPIGIANFGMSHGIQSYSRKEVDDFGNVTITKRAYAKRADYDITVETNKVDGVQDLLATLRDTPIVYIGDPKRRSTIVYGFFRDFSIVLANPAISSCSIEVEGLV